VRDKPLPSGEGWPFGPISDTLPWVTNCLPSRTAGPRVTSQAHFSRLQNPRSRVSINGFSEAPRGVAQSFPGSASRIGSQVEPGDEDCLQQSEGPAVRPTRSRWIVFAVALGVSLGMAAPSRAQLFGDRALGHVTMPRTRQTGAPSIGSAAKSFNLSPKSSASSGAAASPFEGVGMPDPTARYMRGNRDAADFVGADSRDTHGFVGMQQAENNSDAPTTGGPVRVQTGPDANRGQPAASRVAGRMYAPRLRVGFDLAPRHVGSVPQDPAARGVDVNQELTLRLGSSLPLGGTDWVEVSLVGGKATLRGEIESERIRRLAGLLLLLEPGISNVQNELKVRPAPPSQEADRSSPAAKPPATPPVATQPAETPSLENPAPENRPAESAS
jgi:hypothetical protein